MSANSYKYIGGVVRTERTPGHYLRCSTGKEVETGSLEERICIREKVLNWEGFSFLFPFNFSAWILGALLDQGRVTFSSLFQVLETTISFKTSLFDTFSSQ